MVSTTASCGSCGALVTPSARFCASCGAALDTAPAVDVRKIVTALFCDVTGSTELAGSLDPEALRSVMERYFASASEVIARHGGTVEKFVGDAVMAVFGVPAVHEDDALRACRAAMEIMTTVEELNSTVEAAHGERFAVRIGIETGEVLVGDPARRSSFASGPSVNLAARLEQAAGPGECLIGPTCHRLVRDGVQVESRQSLTLKGVADPVPVWRLLAIGDEQATPWLTPLVGRTRELALLQQAFVRASKDRTCQLATVLGVAGMGKSRLTAEFLSTVSGALVLHGRCVAYGEGITYWPLVEAVRQAASLTGSEPETVSRGRLLALLTELPDAPEVMQRVAPLAGLGGVPGPPEDSAWAVRKLLEALAARGPVVLAVEDLHWAEPGLVRLLEEVCAWLRDVPVLLLVNARPEFLDDHPGWGGGQVNGVTALLEPLDDGEVESLALTAIGGALPPDALGRVRELAGGNPLYVEHVMAMFVEDGLLRRGAAGWRQEGATDSLSVPPTVTALIAARLDRLNAEERAVLAPASVMGQVFYRAALAELTMSHDVSASLQSLLRKGLVRPSASDVPRQDALSFSHALIREAAYAALPKATRADLHERFARWLDRTCDGQAYDDFVGSHLEAAYQSLVDLGSVDDRCRELGREAAERLSRAAAGLTHADDDKAAALLERASAMCRDEGPQAWSLRIDLVQALLRCGRPRGEAAAVAETVRSAASASGDLRWATYARLLLMMIRQHTDPEGATDALRAEAESARLIFESIGDDFGLALMHNARASVATIAMRSSEMARELSLAAEHAEAAGRTADAVAFRRDRLFRFVVDDTPADRALMECRQALSVADDRRSRSWIAAHAAFFSTLLGQGEEGENAWRLADELAAEQERSAANDVDMLRSWALSHVGAWERASYYQERVRRTFAAAGAMSFLSTESASSALIAMHLGDVALARQHLATALRFGSSDDVITLALAGGVQAWLAGIDGDAGAVPDHMERALAQLASDALLDTALVHIAGAEAFAALGDLSSARARRRTVIDLYRAKGNVVGAAHHEGLLAASG